jgi:hypothetical protein
VGSVSAALVFALGILAGMCLFAALQAFVELGRGRHRGGELPDDVFRRVRP